MSIFSKCIAIACFLGNLYGNSCAAGDWCPWLYRTEDYALHAACFKGYPHQVLELIQAGRDVNKADYDGNSPLHYAATSGNLCAVRMLLHAGADVNSRTKDDETVVERALHYGHESILKELIETEGLVLAKDLKDHVWIVLNHKRFFGGESELRSPLHEAARNGDLCVVRMSLFAGADVNAICGYQHKTALHLSAESARVPIVELLLQYGANTEIDSNSLDVYPRCKPLHVAANKGYVDIVKLLIEFGADVNAFSCGDGCNTTPLELATRHGRIEVVRLLLPLQKGSLERECDYAGFCAAYYGRHEIAVLFSKEKRIRKRIGALWLASDDAGRNVLNKIPEDVARYTIASFL